jgi:hypothetical protein
MTTLTELQSILAEMEEPAIRRTLSSISPSWTLWENGQKQATPKKKANDCMPGVCVLWSDETKMELFGLAPNCCLEKKQAQLITRLTPSLP